MKRFLGLILPVIIVLSAAMPPAFAEDVEAEGPGLAASPADTGNESSETASVAEIGEAYILAGGLEEFETALLDVPDGGSVSIAADIEVTRGIRIPDNKAVTVTSAGGGAYALKKSVNFEDAMIFIPEGSGLTLTNITLDGGGEDFDEGKGDLVYNYGEFTMQTGAVLQNCRTLEPDGGAVYNYGFFAIQGGTIRGNTNGVYNIKGEVNMSGGEIHTDASEGEGCGIYNDGTLNLSGRVYLEGLCLADEESEVYIIGGIEAGATITLKASGYLVGAENTPVLVAKAGGGYLALSAAELAAFSVIGGEYKLALNNGDTEIVAVEAAVTAGDFDELQNALQNIEDGDILKIIGDIDITAALAIPDGKSVTVSGEGKTLTRRGEFAGAMFTVPENGRLVLKNIILDGDKATASPNAPLVHNKGVFIMETGAVLRNNREPDDLAAVGALNDGILEMTGGEISDDSGLLNRGGLNVSGLMKLYGLYINDGSSIPNVTGALESGAKIVLDTSSEIFAALPAEVARLGGGYDSLSQTDLAAFGFRDGDNILYLSEDETAVIADKKPPDKPASISVIPGEATISVGETVGFTAVAEPANAEQNVIWSSGDVSVASVDETGLVTGLRGGTATITAASKSDAGISASAEVTVLAGALEPEITLHPENQTAYVGKSASFKVEARSPDDGVLSYQWQESGGGSSWRDIAGETSADYTKVGLEKSHTGMLLRCVVTNTKHVSISSRASNGAVLTVLTLPTGIEIKADGMTVSSINLKVNGEKQLTASIKPDAADLREVKWLSNNGLVAGINQSGTVTALAPGIAVVSAKSVGDSSVSAICLVTVTQDEAKPLVEITSEPADLMINGKIEDDFVKNKMVRLMADKDVKWTSNNTKVAAVSALGEVKYLSAGTAVITAALKSDSKVSASIALTLMDKTPRLSVGTVTVNSNSVPGTEFKAFSADYFGFDDIKIANVTPETAGFSLDVSALPACKLSAKAVKNGKYTLELQAYKDGKPVGNTAALTATVMDTIPKATVKIAAFNTFFFGAGAQVTVTGPNLPEIENIVLDADLNENFYIEKQNGQFFIFAKDIFGKLDAKGNPVVKGSLEVHYAGYGFPCVIKNFTVPATSAPPKLVISPASQKLDPLYGNLASFEVDGYQLVSAAHESSQAIFKAPAISEKTITLEFEDGKINPEKSQSFMARLNVMLKDARAPILLKPKIVTVKAGTGAVYKLEAVAVTINGSINSQSRTVRIVPGAANIAVDTVVITPPDDAGGVKVEADSTDKSKLTVSVAKGAKSGSYKFEVTPNSAANPLSLTVKVDAKPLAATVKTEKGNINLLDRQNTQITYIPSIKGTTSQIIGAELDANAKKPTGDYQKFNIRLDESGKAVVTAKTSEMYVKGASYKLRLKFTLEGGSTVSTGDLTVKPAQSAVKHNLPKSVTIYQSRTALDINNRETVDLTPQVPVGARIASLEFPAGSPNAAYWYYFDESSQRLSIWLKDASLVKPGKSALMFSVIYEGQGAQNTGTKANPVYTQKPVALKLPVAVGI